jgi:hypothetical protein
MGHNILEIVRRKIYAQPSRKGYTLRCCWKLILKLQISRLYNPEVQSRVRLAGDPKSATRCRDESCH